MIHIPNNPTIVVFYLPTPEGGGYAEDNREATALIHQYGVTAATQFSFFGMWPDMIDAYKVLLDDTLEVIDKEASQQNVQWPTQEEAIRTHRAMQDLVSFLTINKPDWENWPAERLAEEIIVFLQNKGLA